MPPRPRYRLPVTDPEQLRAALEKLEERDRSLLEMRFGLQGTRPHNLHEIAKLLGISRERVRQLETRALERLATHAGVPLTTEPSATADRAGAARIGRGPSTRPAFTRRWVLMTLALKPGHVYELKKRLNELGVPPVTYRQLYALEEEGLVSSSWSPGRAAGPDRRVYAVTTEGLGRLKADAEILENAAQAITEFLSTHAD